MTRYDIDEKVTDFVNAARMAKEAGFGPDSKFRVYIQSPFPDAARQAAG
jgi:hypothetical protein